MEDLKISELRAMCRAIGLDINSSLKKKYIIKFITSINVDNLDINRLKTLMELINLSTNGTRKDLIKRYRDWLNITSTPVKRKAIPKSLRDNVFSTYCKSYDDAQCFTGCGEKITPFNFECGHVIAVECGGMNTIENLRPICSRCNKSMGIKNMNDFIKECGFNNNCELQQDNSNVTNQETQGNNNDTKITKKVDNITMDTISGDDLQQEVHDLLKNTLNMETNEKIEIIYKFNGVFDQKMTLFNSVFVGITNLRIFKTEDGLAYFTWLSNIKSCRHKKNSIFKWDELIITMNDNSEKGYGIYYYDTVEYFVKYLQMKIQMN
jgi:hypothetical protein